ncbi:AraC family transcriptional regulator [Mesorhizobium sp. BR1-1-16]|uniref:AraC family transcriptional regulator n=1 Tax=Mesorhizobium sp. BR1-1-16 TaxID=2876653 RepID=UPI001CCC6124|nr:AraC family transcriptional regulator [Mesorhizobium sp. BR1-1-16]MBZ9935919.1 AraC family transcriptional regulator [Mesorhizobium sp. BR1-1-16]
MSDPLADVLTVLDARPIRITRFEGAGEWALAFPALDRLKFIALLRGSGWLLTQNQPPLRILAGDCCLIGRSAYTIASDPDVPPIDGSPLYADGNDLLNLGGDETVALGGGISFAPSVGAFLLDLLPAVMHISGATPESNVIAAVLDLLDNETAIAGIGRSIVTTRLAEVLMVQAIRAFATAPEAIDGWFGALADPRLGRALQSLHGDIARPWTVADLAAEAGMSRAAFSAAFNRHVGVPPLAYIRNWRMTRARVALASRHQSVRTVAANVGYTSESAFGHAFRRHFGIAPRQTAE